MKLALYQIDAFTNSVFAGNPAAVCPLLEWLPDNVLQAIAAENNLAETAFFVPQDNGFHLRWFTPTVEVDLCGHATLASAYVLYEILDYQEARIEFHTRSGKLSVTQNEQGLVMDFPSQPPESIPCPDALSKGLGIIPKECWAAADYIAVFDSEAEILAIQPDFQHLKQLDQRGVIITSKSQKYDFVSRFFAPNYGIDEDPVTGSAYTQLTPLWAEKLGKTCLNAKQVSQRGGELKCEKKGDRIFITGQCAHYLTGTIHIPLQEVL